MATKLIDRTAKEPFMLDGEYIRQGRVVQLSQVQVKRLAEAGCVELSDSDNDMVATTPDPDSNVPDLLASTSQDTAVSSQAEQARVAEAQAAADAEIAEIDRCTEATKGDLAKALSDAQVENDKAIADARADADAQIAAISDEVTKARADADTQIASIQAEVEAAKASANTASDATGKSSKS